MKERNWQWLSYAQAGLPVIGAGLLAAFTWWLVQSSPQPEAVRRTEIAPTVPDYTLQSARVSRLDKEGRLKALVDGKEIRHYAQGDRLEIDDVVLSARGDDGGTVQAEARQGEAVGDTEVLTLKGAVRVTAQRPPAAQGAGATPMRLLGEGLKVDGRARVLSADQPTTVIQGSSLVRGDTMRHDEATGITEFRGRVRGRYDLVSRP